LRVQINLFSTLRQYAPGGEWAFELELAPGETAGKLLEFLNIPPATEKVVLVNGRQAKEETRLSDGDRVTLFPPMAGG